MKRVISTTGLVTVAEKAREWGCSTTLIYRWIKQERLKAFETGAIKLIRFSAKRPKPRRGGRPAGKG